MSGVSKGLDFLSRDHTLGIIPIAIVLILMMFFVKKIFCESPFKSEN